MTISKKAEYALRALLAMCRAPAGTVFSIQSLSLEEHIPLKFLEQILLILRKGGVLTSRRGAGGGYQMAKPADRINVGEVLELVDGPLEFLSAGAEVSAGLEAVFTDLTKKVHSWMAENTLADILVRDHLRGGDHFEI